MNVNLYVQSSIQNYSLAAVSSARCEQKGREASPAGKQDSVEIYSLTYVEFLLRQYQCAENTIKEYYAEAHRNNLSWGSIADGMNYISMKYTELGRLMGSSYYRADMSEAERKMALHQERALLSGGRVTIGDPYALASSGGMINIKEADQIAYQAARDRIDELINEYKRANGIT